MFRLLFEYFVLHYVGQVPSVCVHIRFFWKDSPISSDEHATAVIAICCSIRSNIERKDGRADTRTKDSAVVFRAPERRTRGASCRICKRIIPFRQWCSRFSAQQHTCGNDFLVCNSIDFLNIINVSAFEERMLTSDALAGSFRPRALTRNFIVESSHRCSPPRSRMSILIMKRSRLSPGSPLL